LTPRRQRQTWESANERDCMTGRGAGCRKKKKKSPAILVNKGRDAEQKQKHGLKRDV